MTNSPHFPLFAEELDVELAGHPLRKPAAVGVARVLMPNRAQLELRASDLESLLPEGHRARIVWAYVEQADLSAIYAGIKAVEGGSGRTAIAPEILFALWLYATVAGVGSARAIARLTQEQVSECCGESLEQWLVDGAYPGPRATGPRRRAHRRVRAGAQAERPGYRPACAETRR